MEWLSWFFLESPAALGLALFLVLFVLLAYWRRGGSARPLVIGLLAGGALLLVQAVVTTPRERIAAVLAPMEAGLTAGQAGPLVALLAPDFAAGEMDRVAFRDYVEQALQRMRISWLERGRVEILAAGLDRIEAQISYRGQAVMEQGGGLLVSRWRFEFERREGDWLIRAIEPLQLNGVPTTAWSAIQRP